MTEEVSYIGTQFAKPLQDDKIEQNVGTEELPRYELVDNPAPNTYKKYAEAAQWCNEDGWATIEDKGDYYEVVAIPEPSLEEVRERKLAELASAFDTWRDDGATLTSSLGFEADADEKANADVNGLVIKGEPAVFMDAHNVPHQLTLDQLKVLQLEIIDSASYGYQKKWAYRDAIEKATTVEAINAITIAFTPKDFSNTETAE